MTASLPLISSSPMLRMPTVGQSLCSNAATSMAPMMPNWSRCSGPQSTLAPRSSMWVCPLAVGTAAQIAGRSIPGIIFMTNLEIAISAPVLPAETQASASPFLTRFTATRIDESFLLRKAREGDSCISTTSEAWTTRSRELAADFPSSGCSDSSRPTRIRLAAGWASRKRRDAGTVTDGPWSPPMQSMAMRAVMAKQKAGDPGRTACPSFNDHSPLALSTFLPR